MQLQVSRSKKAGKGHMLCANNPIFIISAGGCAFTVTDPVFAEAPGKAIKVTIDDFSLLQGKPLEGIVIRSTNDEGRYVVGCRLIEDNDAICEYVKTKMQ